MSEPAPPLRHPLPIPWGRAALTAAFAVCTVASVAAGLFFDLMFPGGTVLGTLPATLLTVAIFGGAPAIVFAIFVRRRWAWITCAAAWLVVVVMALTPWHPRKRFVRDLDSLRPGMSVDEVEAVMGLYVKGTGWVLPGGVPAVSAYPQREERAHATGTMTYRWCTTGSLFNADWGQVTFKDGRVVEVEFLPD